MSRYSDLFTLFITGAQHVKFPAIKFTSSDGTKVKIYPARNGSIYIKLNGTYTGKIVNEHSNLQLYTLLAQDDLYQEIQAFCSKPVESIKAYGIRTNKCCFCKSKLDSPSSKSVGYGLICAKNYGLYHPDNFHDSMRKKLSSNSN